MEARILLTAGDLDPSFGVGGRVITDLAGQLSVSNDVAIQADGKIVVAGMAEDPSNDTGPDFVVARYNPNGTLDTSFGAGGVVLTDFDGRDDVAYSVLIQPDGKIVAAGSAVATVGGYTNERLALARYNPDGSLDPTFGTDGKVITAPTGFEFLDSFIRDIALQPDGAIVAVGASPGISYSENFLVARYAPDGQLDDTFGSGGITTTDFFGGRDIAYGVTLQEDGKIVAAGSAEFFDPSASITYGALARYNPDGSLDTTFSPGGAAGDGKYLVGSIFSVTEARAVAIDPSDGSLVTAGVAGEPGSFPGEFSSAAYFVVRLDSSGTPVSNLISDFVSESGVVSEVNDLAIDSEGRIIVAGSVRITDPGQGPWFALARYNPDLSPDLSFGAEGVVVTEFPGEPGTDPASAIYAIALQTNGRIVAVGAVETGVEDVGFALARYYAGLSGTFQLSAPTYSVDEDAGTAIVTVTRTGGDEGVVTVEFATSDGTARAPNDYLPVAVTLVFGDGELSRDIPITIIDNDAYGPDKTVILTLSDPTNGAELGTPATGVLTILDNDPPPQFSIEPDVTVVEGDLGTTTVTLFVTLAGATELPASVVVSLVDGTAVAGRDYVFQPPRVLAFEPGVTSQSYEIEVIGDLAIEHDVYFFARLSDPVDSTILDGEAEILILDDDRTTVINTNDSGAGSLRRAIEVANATPDRQIIDFAIPGQGPHTIAPLTPLPAITDLVTIDGRTQEGFAGTPVIEIAGHILRESPGSSGLSVQAPYTLISALAVNRFSGAGIRADGADYLIVDSSHIGTDPTGRLPLGNGAAGILLVNSSNGIIGGFAPEYRNVIAANGGFGGIAVIGLGEHGQASSNRIQNNFIGTDATGEVALGNNFGILLHSAGNNIIGGSFWSSPPNVVSGNTFGGIVLTASSSGNTIADNLIGTNPIGNLPLGNRGSGILLDNSPSNTIGTAGAVASNVISANLGHGVELLGSGSSGNVIQSSYVGVDGSGARAFGNLGNGVHVQGASNNRILDNLISANESGVELVGGSTGNLVSGNRIGTDATGTRPLPNQIGVFVLDASGNQIGAEGVGNLISGNSLVGVRLTGLAASGNLVLNNFIGTDLAGASRVPNGFDGVFLQAPSNVVAGNLISGNASVGVQLFSELATGNIVASNRIGTDVSGLAPLGNARDGVYFNNAPGNQLLGNVISANLSVGVQLFGTGTAGNTLAANLIGPNAEGQVSQGMGNNFGLFINTGSANTLVPNNRIAGNRILDVFVSPFPVNPIEAATAQASSSSQGPAITPTPRGPLANFRPGRANLSRRLSS